VGSGPKTQSQRDEPNGHSVKLLPLVKLLAQQAARAAAQTPVRTQQGTVVEVENAQ
jgi:hypothetical protein